MTRGRESSARQWQQAKVRMSKAIDEDNTVVDNAFLEVINGLKPGLIKVGVDVRFVIIRNL